MNKLKDSFFQAYFKMPVPRIIVRTDAPVYTVISVNNAYRLLTGKSNENIGATGINDKAESVERVDHIDSIERAAGSEQVENPEYLINQSIFTLFNPKNTGTIGQSVLKNAMSEAIRINEQVYITEFEMSTISNGSTNTSWWQIEVLPVSEEDNEKPSYLIITKRDITPQILSQRELEEARHREQTLHEELAATNEELSASNEELSTTVEDLQQAHESLKELNNELENRVKTRTAELIKAQEKLKEQHALLNTIVNEVPAGICVLQGPEMIMKTANRKLLELWQRKNDILDRPLTEVMPELIGQEFPHLLNEVYTTGIPYSRFDAEAVLIIEGVKRTVYRDYSFTPIKSSDGITRSIVAMTIDVTERTLGRLRERQLLEEQAAINEELAASNEELASTNEELNEAQENQQQLIAILAKSESRFRTLIMDAPVAICVLKGKDYLLDAINAEGLNILGKKVNRIGKSLHETLSEREYRPFTTLLSSTYRSGKTYYGNEIQAQFEHEEGFVDGYFNFILKPIKTEEGSIDGIIVVASNVTDLVVARKEKESAEIKLGLAIEAAQMGSWHIDSKTKELQYNSALATLFGYEGTEPMTYAQVIAQVTEDCKYRLVAETEKAIADGGTYDITYTQHRFNDAEVIWLRSLGKINQDEEGNYTLFSGVVMNVTEQKRDEQRKNDFIGMVSHELKTPLTSLNGYAQILHAKAKNNDDTFSINALTKVTDQIKKMTTMINGFLNISRLESGKIQLDKQTFLLNELIMENIEEAEILTTNHKILFKPFVPITVFADRDKIGSVISNMISNAVKYSPEGQQIEISCEVIDSSAQISIKDQGMGISEKDIPKLFDRFYRVESNQTQLISGFGIGLYLSAEIITHHKGRIWVESKPGEGSTFFFSLPIGSVKQ